MAVPFALGTAFAALGAAFLSDDEEERARRAASQACIVVTTIVLSEMQCHGWYPSGKREKSHEMPTPWDINCGWCEEWALAVKKRIPSGEVFWLDELYDFGEDAPGHAVFRYQDRYYDAQHPEGVSSIFELSLVRKVSREEWLKSKD